MYIKFFFINFFYARISWLLLIYFCIIIISIVFFMDVRNKTTFRFSQKKNFSFFLLYDFYSKKYVWFFFRSTYKRLFQQKGFDMHIYIMTFESCLRHIRQPLESKGFLIKNSYSTQTVYIYICICESKFHRCIWKWYV